MKVFLEICAAFLEFLNDPNRILRPNIRFKDAIGHFLWDLLAAVFCITPINAIWV